MPSQQSEPPQQQPNQHTQMQTHQMATSEVISAALPMVKPTLTEQQVETDQLTSVATQQCNCSCSTPVLLPVTHEDNGWYRHQAGQSQWYNGYINIPEFYPSQVKGIGRVLQPMPYCDLGINLISALEGYSSWQVLTQMAVNSVQEFDGTNKEATIPWLDHIKAIAKKTGFNPLAIGMSKLKGTTLCNVNAISKKCNLVLPIPSTAYRALFKCA